MSRVPERTCVGCGRKAPRAALWRFVAPAGVLTADPDGLAPGRGAYTCPSPACVTRAVDRKGFARAFRRDVEVPADLQAVSNEG